MKKVLKTGVKLFLDSQIVFGLRLITNFACQSCLLTNFACQSWLLTNFARQSWLLTNFDTQDKNRLSSAAITEKTLKDKNSLKGADSSN